MPASASRSRRTSRPTSSFGPHFGTTSSSSGQLEDPLSAARSKVLSYVVVSSLAPEAIVQQFQDAGWTTRPLGASWSLLSVPNAGPGTCLA